MDRSLIAVEYERGLHAINEFTVANKAKTYLNHQLNVDRKGKPLFHHEGTLHQTEFNSIPTSSIDQLCLNFLEAEAMNRKICQELGVASIPISENGAGVAQINPIVEGRTLAYQIIIRKRNLERLIKNSGIHIHIDVNYQRFAEQFNALTALVPTIALASTSPISAKGVNGVNCHRYKEIFDKKEGVFSEVPEERNYIATLQDLTVRDENRFRKLLDYFQAGEGDIRLPENYQFKKYFQVDNTGYPEIRHRPNNGRGTFELRFFDTTPMEIAIGLATLILGYNNRILNENIPVEVAKKDGIYSFNQERVILPNKETLNYYTDLAAKRGLKNEEVKQYNQTLEYFARGGLRCFEQQYLEPLQKMLSSGENIASQIIRILGGKKIYTPQESAKATEYVWNVDQEGIERLNHKAANTNHSCNRSNYLCVAC